MLNQNASLPNYPSLPIPVLVLPNPENWQSDAIFASKSISDESLKQSPAANIQSI